MHKRIERCTAEDIPELNALVNVAYRGPESKHGWTSEADLVEGLRIDQEYLHQLFDRHDIIMLKCMIEDQLSGCVLLEKEKTTCHLGMLSVVPVLQNQGIGKLLLQASEEVAKTQGCERIQITVISVRQELIDWYIRHGFADTGERQPFPTKDQTFGKPTKELEFLIMQKPFIRKNFG